MADSSKNKMTSRQARAIDAIIRGAHYTEAAALAGVHVRTLYRWNDTPEFTAALRRRQSRAAQQHVAALSGELEHNRAVMIACRDDSNAPWHTRLRAAVAIEDSLLRWKTAGEIEERLAALEKLLP